MTCLVYRDGVLASDSVILSRMLVCSGAFRKVGKRTIHHPIGGFKPYLFGGTGETALCQKFRNWVMSEDFEGWAANKSYPTPSFEPIGKDESFTGFVITPDGACWHFEGAYAPFVTRHEFYAFGSGAMVAIGALAQGASAEEAVAIAIEYDSLTNGEVQKVSMYE